MKSLLRNRSLVLIGITESISNVGNWITMMALYSLLVFEGTGGIAESSGIMLAGLVPLLFISPLAGWLCDRWDRKWLMVASQALSALPVIGLMVVQQLEWIYLFLVIQTVFGSLMLPARQAAVPTLVAPEELPRANAFLQQLGSFTKIGAPFLGGLLVAAVGPHQAMIFDVISFLVAAALLVTLPSLPAGRAPGIAPGAGPEAAPASLRGLFGSSPDLVLLFGSAFLTVFTVMGFDVLAPVFLRDALGQDGQFFGLLIGLIGIGALAGTLWLMLRKREGEPWRDLVAGLLLLAAIPATMAIAPLLSLEIAAFVAALGCLVGGVGNGLVVVHLGTLLQRSAPDGTRGRVGGIFQSVVAAAQLGAILVAPLLVPAWLSLAAYFALTTALMGLVALSILPVKRALSSQRLAPTGTDAALVP